MLVLIKTSFADCLKYCLLLSACAFLLPSAAVSKDSDEIISLSLQELMNIPLTEHYSRKGIFQSDTNKISEHTINFGILAPISSFPAYSGEIIAAADLATQHINRYGGINGKRLVIIRADDEENTPVSAELAQKLIDDYQVEAIFGPATSTSTAYVLNRVLKDRTIPLITQGASAVKLSELAGDAPFWRMIANNHQQVEQMVNHVHNKMGHKKVYVIKGRDIYSQEIGEGVKRLMSMHKNTQVDDLTLSALVDIEGMDLSEEIKQIQAQGYTAIVVTLANHQMTDILRKVSDHWEGDYPLILAADTAKPTYLLNAKLGKIYHCTLTYVSTPAELDPEIRDRITSLLNIDSAAFDAAYIYDAIVIIAMAKQLATHYDIDLKTAVNKIASNGHPISHLDYPDIIKLFKTHNHFSYSGYSGRVWFNNHGDNIKAIMDILPLVKLETTPNCLQPQ